MSIEKTGEHSYTIINDKKWYSTMSNEIHTKIKSYDDYFVKDEITKAVVLDLASRAERGVKKYNTTLGENNHQNMLQHAYEEALDLAQYLKKEILTLNTIQDLVNQYPNDMELGKAIREKYGKK
jgi:predicted phage-related endonuclease